MMALIDFVSAAAVGGVRLGLFCCPAFVKLFEAVVIQGKVALRRLVLGVIAERIAASTICCGPRRLDSLMFGLLLVLFPQIPQSRLNNASKQTIGSTQESGVFSFVNRVTLAKQELQ
jgi:hypothetical protein